MPPILPINWHLTNRNPATITNVMDILPPHSYGLLGLANTTHVLMLQFTPYANKPFSRQATSKATHKPALFLLTGQQQVQPPTSQLVALQEALCFQVSVLDTFNQLAGAFVAVHRASRACGWDGSPDVPHPNRRLLQVCTKAKLPCAAILGRLVSRSACCTSGWRGAHTVLRQ